MNNKPDPEAEAILREEMEAMWLRVTERVAKLVIQRHMAVVIERVIAESPHDGALH